MIYRLTFPCVYTGRAVEVHYENLYLEAGSESPSGDQFVDTMEMLAETASRPYIWEDGIKVIKNLGDPDIGWQEYFPYLRSPDMYGMAIQCMVESKHPDYPELGKLEITMTWVKVFTPYTRSLLDLRSALQFVKSEDKDQLGEDLRKGLA